MEAITAEAAQAIADEAPKPSFDFADGSVTLRWPQGAALTIRPPDVVVPGTSVRLVYELTKEAG